MLIAVLKNEFIVSFIITFCTFSFGIANFSRAKFQMQGLENGATSLYIRHTVNIAED